MALPLLLVASFVVPLVLGYALRRTRLWWLPSVLLAIGGVYLLATLDHGDHRGEGPGAAADLGNVLQTGYAIALFVLAVVLAALGAIGRYSQSRDQG